LTGQRAIRYRAHMTETAVVTVTVEGKAGYAQTIRSGSHAWTSDEPVSRGGTDSGPNPTALLLSALASCTAITLRMYADRKTWDLGVIRVRCALFRQKDERPRIEREMTFSTSLSEEQRDKILGIAAKTPVTRIVMDGAEISTKIG
jgi:putative redox protein